MADKRDLLAFRHLQHSKLEKCRMIPTAEIIPCKCGVRHKIMVSEARVTTIHCRCGRSIEIVVEKPSKAA